MWPRPLRAATLCLQWGRAAVTDGSRLITRWLAAAQWLILGQRGEKEVGRGFLASCWQHQHFWKSKKKKKSDPECPATPMHLSQQHFKHKLWLVNTEQGPPDCNGSQLWSCLNFRANSQTERAQTAGKVHPPRANAVQWKSLETTAAWMDVGAVSFLSLVSAKVFLFWPF